MTKYVLLSIPLLLLTGLLLAQSTYVANSANTNNPPVYGSFNTIVGPTAGSSGSLSGIRNALVGYGAGRSLTTANDNSFFGVDAGQQTTTGGQNVFVGYEAGLTNTTGTENVFVGTQAGKSNSTGSYNSFMGYQAGSANNTGSGNSFMGYQAGYNNTTGTANLFMGNYAGDFNNTGSNNSFVGYSAGLANTAGANNVFVGYQAGYKNTTASNNVFIGYQAGLTNTTGIGNLFLGNGAGAGSNGSYNLFIGNGSGGNNISGLGNTFIGDGSGYGNAYGQNNTYIGRAVNFSGNAFGSQNTFIGYQARINATGTNVDNATAIGVNAVVSQSNSVILGAADARVGIGNTAPQNKLEITQGIANQSGLRLTNLLISSPATAVNQTKFLTVNSAGDVILGSVNGSTREGVSETLWQRNGSFLQSTQNDAVIIGEGVSKTPSEYNLFVSKGILTEKVKVAVKNTADWSDKVFDEGYTLRGLSEVEHYVQANKHLPGVPSAKEVVEKGVDVAKMDAKLLEKIEELTLYSIDQQKENQALKTRVGQLESQHKKEIDELKAMVKQLLEKK